jgi:hypothetical protein
MITDVIVTIQDVWIGNKYGGTFIDPLDFVLILYAVADTEPTTRHLRKVQKAQSGSCTRPFRRRHRGHREEPRHVAGIINPQDQAQSRYRRSLAVENAPNVYCTANACHDHVHINALAHLANFVRLPYFPQNS